MNGNMKIRPLISVIIPVYNVRPYLAESLDSVIRQTYDNLEILIIDDGSTDGSGIICDEYAKKDHRIIVIHQENRGLSNARNTGLEKMTGDVVAFLDSDDSYDPSFINTMITTMIHENAEIVMCKYTNHDTVERMVRSGKEPILPLAEQNKYTREQALREHADDLIDVCVWNKICKSELYEDIRFSDGHVFEDRDTFYKIIDKCNSFIVLNQPLYCHRIRQGSITNSMTWDYIMDRLLANFHFFQYVKTNTPEIFSINQLYKSKRRMQACLDQMIVLFIRKGKTSGIRKYNNMRRDIIESQKAFGIETSSFTIKLIYLMICFCPSVINMLSPLYSHLKPIRYLKRDADHEFECETRWLRRNLLDGEGRNKWTIKSITSGYRFLRGG